MDAAPQNRINDKTKDVLSIGDVFADITQAQVDASSIYGSLTLAEKKAMINEFNTEFSDISADAWNSATNQVIGGANTTQLVDNTSTAELDIISEKVPLDDINTHETFSSVDVHPFVAGSAVQFLDESTTAGIDTSVSYFVGQIVAGQEYSLYLSADDATNNTNVVQLNDITSVSHLSIHGETLFGAAVNGLSNDVITVVGTTLRTGQRILIKGGNGTLPSTGLAYATDYFVSKLSDTTFKLCSTYADSIAGTNFLSLTDTEDMSGFKFDPYEFYFDSISSNKIHATDGYLETGDQITIISPISKSLINSTSTYYTSIF